MNIIINIFPIKLLSILLLYLIFNIQLIVLYINISNPFQFFLRLLAKPRYMRFLCDFIYANRNNVIVIMLYTNLVEYFMYFSFIAF